MYSERKEKLGIWNYLVYIFLILLILIIVFIIIFKGNKKKVKEKPKEMVLYSEEQLNKIESDYSEDLAANMASFKYNVIEYYKDKLGNEKVDMILTLQDFYDKHFIEELSVGENKCDGENSKVEVTKKSGEYKFDFTLICGEDKALMDTYLGKYSYCKNDDICEKKIEKKPKKESDNAENSDYSDKNKTNELQEDDKEIETKDNNDDSESNKSDSDNKNIKKAGGKYTFYEYSLTPSNQTGNYTEWSDWSKDIVDSSLMVDVETKEETETKTSDCNETKEESYISSYNTETYISGYITKKYQVGIKKVQTGTKQVKIRGKIVNQPIYEEQPIYQTKEEPVYKTKQTPVYSTRQVTVDNCTSVVKYYRYRKFTYKKGINYIKYSISDNDQFLLNSGYTKTGNTKEF